MADLIVYIDEDAALQVISDSPGTMDAIAEVCEGIAGRANSMAAGYKSGVWHEYGAEHPPGNGVWVDRGVETVDTGGTPALYETNTQRMGGTIVGIIYTANYAAQQENMQHNTLLKAI